MQLFGVLLRYYRMPFLLIGFCMALIVIRLVRSESFFFLFLGWNLFLAVVPYLITQSAFFYGIHRIPKTIQFVLFTTWLLFLPNAPYLITDLVHLHSTYSNQKWFDLFLVFVFALTGWLFGMLSLLDFYGFLKKRISRKIKSLVITGICFLTGYGLYLGRFLRFNSWDIAFKTRTLIVQVTASLTKPHVWSMTLAFGTFLLLSFYLVKWLKEEA